MSKNMELTGDAPAFSIIIPVYNTESYIKDSLASAMAQSVSSIEIIIVDDGSKDSSLAIVADLAEQDERIHILVQENAGQGVARNLGLAHARGENIIFLDSDDVIESSLCERVESAFRSDADVDVVSFGLRFETGSGKVVARRGVLSETTMVQPEIFQDAMLDRTFLSSPCNKAYRRRFLVDNGISFPPTRAYEDALFARHVAMRVGKVLFIPDILYRAAIRPGSTTRGMSSRNFIDAVAVIEHERKLFGASCDEAVFEAHVVRFLTHLLILAAYRVDDPGERAECRRLAEQAGLLRYARRPSVLRLLSRRSRLQLQAVHHPRLLRMAARVARRLNIEPY